MKYHPEQIQQMAVQYIMAEAFGDPRAGMVIERLSAATGVHPEECRIQIHQLAVTNLNLQPAHA